MAYNSRSLYKYTTDQGDEVAITLADGIATAMGFTAADGTEGARPAGLKLRKAHFKWFSSGGAGLAVGKFVRQHPVPTLASDFWTLTTRTVQLADIESNGTVQSTPNILRTFNMTGLTGESRTLGR